MADTLGSFERLREGGDRERVEVLEEMLSLFGAEGPAEDHDVRRGQVAEILRDHPAAVEALDQKTQSAARCIFVAQSLFALRYPEDFRSVD